MKRELETKQQIADISKELQNKSYPEIKSWILDKKEKGDQYYKEKKFDEATAIYLKGLMGLSSGTKEETKKLADEFMAKLTLNMAMSELEANRGRKALILATNVIKREPNNPLGYFRKGVICDRLEEFEFAL